MSKNTTSKFDKAACLIAKSTGTPASLVIHTIIFASILSLYFFGIEMDTVLLVLTTLLSVEAIYLGILNQMINNKIVEGSPDIDI